MKRGRVDGAAVGEMLRWAKELVDDRLKDCLAVVLPNGAVLAAINLSRINTLIQILAGLITIGYAVWRWRRDARERGPRTRGD